VICPTSHVVMQGQSEACRLDLVSQERFGRWWLICHLWT
jgi:hypothetical protein